MEQEDNNIKIPIKDIVQNAVMQNGCNYPEDEFNLIRKYFIACLNLGYLVPSDLVAMVHKFCSRIKFITTNYTGTNNLDYYVINQGVLYLNGALKDNDIDLYEINYYKALSEVIFGVSANYRSFSNALCEMTAEKIYQMDVNSSRMVMPVTTFEMVENNELQLRAGYRNYNLIINLLKQYFISKGFNENKIIKDMFFDGYDNVSSRVIVSDNDKLIITILDKINLFMLNRKISGKVMKGEKELIDKYQIIVNNLFTTIDQNYLAFCALVTTDDLREKLMKHIETKLG